MAFPVDMVTMVSMIESQLRTMTDEDFLQVRDTALAMLYAETDRRGLLPQVDNGSSD